jgi:hypothetical protein
MRALLLTLFFGMASGRLGEWDCGGCTVLIDQKCMAYDIGEKCMPDNYKELVRDFRLYREFYYLEEVLIEDFRCLDYGISLRFVRGMEVGSNLTRDEYNLLYKGYFTKECENWSFAPYGII